MKLWKPMILAIGIGLAWSAFGQSEDEIMKQIRERIEADLTARNEAAFKRMPPEVGERFRRYKAAIDAATTRINGKETPELVPYHSRMSHFFALYSQAPDFITAPRSQLSPADLAVLDTFAERYETSVKESSGAEKKFLTELGAQAQSMSAVEIAAARKAHADRSIANLTARYQNIMRQLTPEGQQIVNQWTYDNIDASYVTVDMMAVAQAEPETYKQQFLQNYEWRLKGGGLPPGVEKYLKEISTPQAGIETRDLNEPKAEFGGKVGSH